MPLYSGKVNSPYTTLSGAINDSITEIDIIDSSVLPSAPNIAVIGYDQDNPETILYEEVAGNTLKQVTREFDKDGSWGEKQSWAAGIKIARIFTAYDYNSMKSAVDDVVVDLSVHDIAISGVHGVGAGIVAKVGDIAVDANLSSAAQAAIIASHARSHALDGTSDHSVGSLTSGYLVKTDGTKLVNDILSSSVVNLTGVQVLTNKTLTSPVINTPTISGGSIAGITDLAVADGGTGSSTAAGARTNLGISQANIVNIGFIIDGGGSAITTGQKGHIEVPFACTISGWTLVADQSGNLTVDVWRDTYANFPPTVADSITGTEKPTISGVAKNQDLSLTTWSGSVSVGDVLAFNVDVAATVTRATLNLRANKT